MPARSTSRSPNYTFFLNEAAGIIDDLIVTRLGDERFMVVANAGNAVADEKHLRDAGRGFRCQGRCARPRLPGDPGTGSLGRPVPRRHRDRLAAVHARHRAAAKLVHEPLRLYRRGRVRDRPAGSGCARLWSPNCSPTSACCGSALPPATACGWKPGSACMARTSRRRPIRPAPALMWAIPKDIRASRHFHRRRCAARDLGARRRRKSASA